MITAQQAIWDQKLPENQADVFQIIVLMEEILHHLVYIKPCK